MNKAVILARKDVNSYFYSWLGILVFVFFFLISGILFSFLVTNYAKVSAEAVQNQYRGAEGLNMTHFIFGSFFINMGVIIMFLIPLVSMRAFSEERRQQTLELLFTYPLSDFDIVIGKFLGLFWFLMLLILPTMGYLCFFQWLGGAFEWGPIIAGYLGLFLLGAAFLSLGLFISSLTGNQVISALVTFSLLILLWALEWVSNITDGLWSRWIQQFSPLNHFREFTFGILDLNHVAYFCFFVLYFIFLTLRSIETRNWKT